MIVDIGFTGAPVGGSVCGLLVGSACKGAFVGSTEGCDVVLGIFVGAELTGEAFGGVLFEGSRVG